MTRHQNHSSSFYTNRAYSFHVSSSNTPDGDDGGVGDLFPVSFPPDILSAPGVPQRARQMTTLPHGDVVSAVALATNSPILFTGGKVGEIRG